MPKYITFDEALRALNNGAFVARKSWCWDGKAVFVYKVEESNITLSQLRGRCKDAINYVLSRDPAAYPIEGTIHINAHIDMKAPDGSIIVGWIASQTDMQADDWFIL